MTSATHEETWGWNEFESGAEKKDARVPATRVQIPGMRVPVNVSRIQCEPVERWKTELGVPGVPARYHRSPLISPELAGTKAVLGLLGLLSRPYAGGRWARRLLEDLVALVIVLQRHWLGWAGGLRDSAGGLGLLGLHPCAPRVLNVGIQEDEEPSPIVFPHRVRRCLFDFDLDFCVKKKKKRFQLWPAALPALRTSSSANPAVHARRAFIASPSLPNSTSASSSPIQNGNRQSVHGNLFSCQPALSGVQSSSLVYGSPRPDSSLKAPRIPLSASLPRICKTADQCCKRCRRPASVHT